MGRLCLTKFFCFFLTLVFVSCLFLSLAPSAYALEWSSTDSSNLAKIANSLYTSATVSAVSRLTDIYNILKYTASNSNSPLYPIYHILDTWDDASGPLSNLSGIKSALDTLKTSASSSTSTFYPMYQKLDSMNTDIGDIETELKSTGSGSIKGYLSDIKTALTSSGSGTIKGYLSDISSGVSNINTISKLFTYDTSYTVSVFGNSSRTLTYYGLHNALIGALNQVIDGLTFIGTQDPSQGGSVAMDTVNDAATKYSVAYQTMLQSYRDIGSINDKLGDVQFYENPSFFFNLPDDLVFFTAQTHYRLYPSVTIVSDPSHTSSSSIYFTVTSSSINTLADPSSGGTSSVNYIFTGNYSMDVPSGTYTFPAGFCPLSVYDSSTLTYLTPSSWQTQSNSFSLPSGGTFYSFAVSVSDFELESINISGNPFPSSGFTVSFDAVKFHNFTNLFQRLYNDITLLSNFFASPTDIIRKEDQKEVVNDILGEGVSGDAKVKVSDVKSVAGTASTLLGLLSSPAKVTDLPDAIDDALSSDEGPLSWFSQDTASDLDSVVSPASLDPSQEIVTSYYDDQLQEVLDWFSQR